MADTKGAEAARDTFYNSLNSEENRAKMRENAEEMLRLLESTNPTPGFFAFDPDYKGYTGNSIARTKEARKVVPKVYEASAEIKLRLRTNVQAGTKEEAARMAEEYVKECAATLTEAQQRYSLKVIFGPINIDYSRG